MSRIELFSARLQYYRKLISEHLIISSLPSSCNFPAKAKNRMEVMQSMIKTYALWVEKNDILTENTVDVTSKTFEAIKLLDSCISDEHSLFNGKTKITPRRPLKR